MHIFMGLVDMVFQGFPSTALFVAMLTSVGEGIRLHAWTQYGSSHDTGQGGHGYGSSHDTGHCGKTHCTECSQSLYYHLWQHIASNHPPVSLDLVKVRHVNADHFKGTTITV